MRVLFSAFACDPYKGSEAQCGWAWVEAMSAIHEVHVITRNENKKSIEAYISEKNESNIYTHYCDVPKYLNTYNTYHRWYFVYYLMWQVCAYHAGKKLNKQFDFDVIHHVSLGDLRMPGRLWRLNTRFVFGPVGGGQTTPPVLTAYTQNHVREEKKREDITNFVLGTSWYRKAINKATIVYAANEETQKRIQTLLDNPQKCKLMTENGIRNEYFSTLVPRTQKANNMVVMLWAGRVVYRKGLVFLLDVLENLDTPIPWKMLIIGDGPDKAELLDRYSSMKKNKDKIEILNSVSYEDMKKYYSNSDFFVFPSLRETTGTVLFEAMANHLPIVTFNQNGAKVVLDRECAKLIDVSSDDLEKVKQDFMISIKELIESSTLREKMGEMAYQRLRENYMWEEKVKRVDY